MIFLFVLFAIFSFVHSRTLCKRQGETQSPITSVLQSENCEKGRAGCKCRRLHAATSSATIDDSDQQDSDDETRNNNNNNNNIDELECNAGLICNRIDRHCVRPTFCAMGDVGCRCTPQMSCNNESRLVCKDSTCIIRDMKTDCNVDDGDAVAVNDDDDNSGSNKKTKKKSKRRIPIGCACTADSVDDISGGCAVPSICINNVCSLPWRTDALHGGEPGDPCDPCDGSCWLGFRCNSISRCVSCIGALGCPCRRNATCDATSGAGEALQCVEHTFRSNNASVPAGLISNVWNYEVRLQHAATLRTNRVEEIRFELIQRMANSETRAVHADELMLTHGRLVHVVAALDDADASRVAFWHVHPDDFAPVEQFLLRFQFPYAGSYVVSFEFMHMVDGLLRFASVSRLVDVVDKRKRTTTTTTDDDDDDDDTEKQENGGRGRIIENDDVLLNGRFTAIAFEKPDTYSQLQRPVSRNEVDDDDDDDGGPAIPTYLTIERGASLYAGSCRLLTFSFGDENSSLGVYLHAAVHVTSMLTALPRNDPFVIHAHGHVSESEARSFGCRQNHQPYKGVEKIQPNVYAMIPFPVVGQWRIFAQVKYFGTKVSNGALLTVAFTANVTSPPMNVDAIDSDGVKLSGKICALNRSSSQSMGGDVFRAGELEDRQRQWLEIYEGRQSNYYYGYSNNLSTTLLTGALIVLIAVCSLKRLRDNNKRDNRPLV